MASTTEPHIAGGAPARLDIMATTADSPRRDAAHVIRYVARPAAQQDEGLWGTFKTVGRVVLVIGATFSSLAVGVVLKLFVFPVDQVIGRTWMDRYVVGAWADGVVGGPVFPRGCRLKLSGELPRPDHRAGLLIANHQLDTDWFYLWDMLRVVGAHGALKIVLLDDMRSVPIVGWCMRLVGFIFVSRHRKRARQQDDVAEIERAVAEVAEARRPSVVLLFPEGTTANEEAKRKAEAYAKRMRRPAHELLLVPRCGGFVAAIRGFVSRGALVEDVLVYDSTMAYAGYGGEVPAWDMGFERSDDVQLPNVAKLFKGDHGDHVRLHTVAYRASEIFADGAYATPLEALRSHEAERIAAAWLDARWAEKDAMMVHYAEHGDFPGAGDVVEVLKPAEYLPFGLLTAGWLAAAAAATLALLVATLLAMPALFVAALLGTLVVACVLPFVACAACALGPLALGALAIKHWHDAQPSRGRGGAFADAGDDDDDVPVFGGPGKSAATSDGAARDAPVVI